MTLFARKLLGVLALVLCATAPCTATAAPTPAPADFYGANVQALFRAGFVKPAQWPAYLHAGDAAGLTIARYDGSWAAAEPKAPGADGVHHYTWTQLDQVATALATAGMRWLPVIDLPPGWVSQPGDALPDARVPDFAAFAGAFAARYGPGGAFWAAHPLLPQLPVQQAEVWTEANSSHFWTSNPDAARYLAVFEQVRSAIKAVAPQIQVLVSLGWQDFDGFMQQLYAAGLRGQSDGVAFHPYAPTARGVVVLTRKLREELAANDEPDLPIYMTEIGWPEASSGPGAPRAYDGPISDAARAGTAALTADALAASDCDVKDYLFYSLVEAQRNPSNNEDWLGLLNADGSPTQTFHALAGSASRWSAEGLRARSAQAPALLGLCHGRIGPQVAQASPMAAGGRLPVSLSVTIPPAGSCVQAQVGYFGNPLEDVGLTLRSYRGHESGMVTHTDGAGRFCVSAASRAKPFLVWGRVGALATTPVLRCARSRCAPISCRVVQLTATGRPRAPTRMDLRLAVRCGRAVLFGEPVRITGVDAAGRPHRLAALLTGTKRQTVHLHWKPAWHVRWIHVRFAGDRAFLLFPRTRVISAARGR